MICCVICAQQKQSVQLTYCGYTDLQAAIVAGAPYSKSERTKLLYNLISVFGQGPYVLLKIEKRCPMRDLALIAVSLKCGSSENVSSNVMPKYRTSLTLGIFFPPYKTFKREI